MTYNSLNTQVPWPPLLAQQLDVWQGLTTITEAEIVLDHQSSKLNSFRVKVRLEVSGPVLRSEGSDTTLEGALHLATADLENQIQARKSKPNTPRKRPKKSSAGAKRKA